MSATVYRVPLTTETVGRRAEVTRGAVWKSETCNKLKQKTGDTESCGHTVWAVYWVGQRKEKLLVRVSQCKFSFYFLIVFLMGRLQCWPGRPDWKVEMLEFSMSNWCSSTSSDLHCTWRYYYCVIYTSFFHFLYFCGGINPIPCSIHLTHTMKKNKIFDIRLLLVNFESSFPVFSPPFAHIGGCDTLWDHFYSDATVGRGQDLKIFHWRKYFSGGCQVLQWHHWDTW